MEEMFLIWEFEHRNCHKTQGWGNVRSRGGLCWLWQLSLTNHFFIFCCCSETDIYNRRLGADSKFLFRWRQIGNVSKMKYCFTFIFQLYLCINVNWKQKEVSTFLQANKQLLFRNTCKVKSSWSVVSNIRAISVHTVTWRSPPLLPLTSSPLHCISVQSKRSFSPSVTTVMQTNTSHTQLHHHTHQLPIQWQHWSPVSPRALIYCLFITVVLFF